MLVPGLRNTIALDFHLAENALYWTDVVEDKIYRGKLSENGGECLLLHTHVYRLRLSSFKSTITFMHTHYSERYALDFSTFYLWFVYSH